MRRRAEPAEDRPKPPPWTRQILAGLLYASEHLGDGGRGVSLQRRGVWLERQRYRWCQENGCYRAGKTCQQVFGRPCSPPKEADDAA